MALFSESSPSLATEILPAAGFSARRPGSAMRGGTEPWKTTLNVPNGRRLSALHLSGPCHTLLAPGPWRLGVGGRPRVPPRHPEGSGYVILGASGLAVASDAGPSRKRPAERQVSSRLRHATQQQ